MGLEGHHQPLIAKLAGHGQKGVKLVGVVGVVIVDLGTVILPLVLKAAARAGKVGQTGFHGAAGQTQHIGGGGGGQSVADVVLATHLQFHMGVDLAVDHNVKAGETVGPGDVLRAAVGLGIVEAEPEQRAVQTIQSCSGAGVIIVGNHMTGLLRY